MPEKSHTNDKGKNQEQYEGKMSDRKKEKEEIVILDSMYMKKKEREQEGRVRVSMKYIFSKSSTINNHFTYPRKHTLTK